MGVARRVKIVAVKVLNDQGSGTWDAVINGINHVANSRLPKRILSMSLGGGAFATLDNAVASTVAAGVLVVVAAGNDNRPACNYSPGELAVSVSACRYKHTQVWLQCTKRRLKEALLACTLCVCGNRLSLPASVRSCMWRCG